jgi:ADP-heptose:LPS heptosyltransferase
VAWTAQPLGDWVQAAVQRVIQESPYPPPGVHAAAWLHRSLAPLWEQYEHAPTAEPPRGWLSLTQMDRAWGRAALAGLGLDQPTILHPGAGATWKRWPAASFARLALALRDRGHQIALVEGPADEEAVREVLAQAGPLPVIREADLRALARLLAQARSFVGNDSGVTHLAAMAGARTIALFGPTDPASWAPLGDVHILRHCRDATRRQGEIRICTDPECMAAIAVEEVLEVIDIHC